MKDLFTALGSDDCFFNDAFTQSNRSDYLYAWDLNLGDALISNHFMEDFCLPGAYLSNFHEVWRSLLLPDDLLRFQQELETLLQGTGTQLCVELQIRAVNNCMRVRCYGSLSRNLKDGSPEILAGYLHRLKFIPKSKTLSNGVVALPSPLSHPRTTTPHKN